MKKITLLLVIIFTVLFSTTSWGEWEPISVNGSGDTLYFDKDRVRKSGKYLYFWELQDYKKPNPYGNLSTTSYVQLDCSIFRFKWLKFKSYKKSMGEGNTDIDVTPPDKWSYPPPKSMVDIMYTYICEEQQKILGNLKRKKRGVFYIGERNGKFGYYTEKWEGLETEDNMDYVKYEGEIKNGNPNGQGTFTWSNGDKYEGEIKNGREHGQGTKSWSSGSKSIGEWKNGEIWNGTGYDKDGNILLKYVNGEW
jgi:hypothetical protein